MSLPPINRASTIAEVRAAFADYEAALVRHDVAALNNCFLQRPDTVRFGLAEHNYGAPAIAGWRAAAAAVDASRHLLKVVIVTFGDDTASVCAEFESALSPRRGRQSQLWVRRPEGWRIAAAHVSEIDATLLTPR